MENIKRTNNAIYNFFKIHVIKKSFYLPFLFFLIVGYGFSLLNRTISIDDLSRDIYYGSSLGKIAGTRWGQYFIIRFLSSIKINPFYEQLIGLLFLVVSSIVICSIFYLINSKEKTIIYTLTVSIFITYPLINEIWVYNEACIPLGFMTFIVSYISLYLLINNNIKSSEYFLLGIMFSVVVSGLEQTAFTYVTIVMSIIYLKNRKHQYDDKKHYIADGIRYVIPIMIGIFVRYTLGFLLIKLFDINYKINGAGSIYWFT